MSEGMKTFVRGYIRAILDVLQAVDDGTRAKYFDIFVGLVYQAIDRWLDR